MQKGEEEKGSKEKRRGHGETLAGSVDDIHTLAAIMHDEPLRGSSMGGGG